MSSIRENTKYTTTIDFNKLLENMAIDFKKKPKKKDKKFCIKLALNHQLL